MISILALLGYIVLSYIAVVVSLLASALLFEPGTSLQQKVQFYGRFLAAFGCMVVCAIYGMTASVILRVVGKAGLGQYVTARSFKWTVYFCCDVWFDIIEGEEHLKQRPAVFLGNHQTELDILFLGTIFPPYCSVSAKKSLVWVPFLGWFMALSKTVFIDRANRENALKAFQTAAQQMHSEKQSVYIFPEGTRSYGASPDLLPFKKGAFHLAIQAQVPVVPIVAANYAPLLSFQKKIFNRGRIPVVVLEPIPTKGLEAKDAGELMEMVRERMLVSIKSLDLKTKKGAWKGKAEVQKVIEEQKQRKNKANGENGATANGSSTAVQAS